MDYLHEEQDLGKVYDARLMKRLLAYARPYRKLIALCVVLLLAIAVIYLARPYLIKVAIDNYILGFGQRRKREGAECRATQALRDQDIGAIIRLGWILFAIMTAGFVLNYVKFTFAVHRPADRLRHPPAHLRPYARLGLSLLTAISGRLVTRVTNDTENLLRCTPQCW